MKKICRKLTSLLLAIVILVSMVAVIPTAQAVSYNPGKRGTVCTALSTSAKSYYTGSYVYSTLSGQSSSTLKTNLKNLMTNTHSTKTSYSGLTTYTKYSDANAGSSSQITLFYTSSSVSGTWDNGTTWNREHVWPQSLGTFTTSNCGSDLHHLRPADPRVNSTRGNLPYGVVTNGSYSTAKTASGTVAGYYTSKYYEPLANVKGDIARILLYVYVRWGETNLTDVIQSTDVLLDWCESDPVDTWEMGRNDVVESIQGNRNVFIDYPEYAWLIFGKSVPTMTTPSGMASVGSGSSSGGSSGSTTTYTVSFSGATASSVSCTSGSSVTLPTPTSTASGYTFVGWTPSNLSSATTTKPTCYAAGASYKPTANTTLYALYSYTQTSTSSGSSTTTSSWNLVTSSSDLTSGSTYVIAANTKDCVAGAFSSSYLTSVSATFSSDKSTITSLPSTATQFTLGGSTGSWTLTSSSGKLAATAAKKINLSGSGTSSWKITVASTGVATITNTTSSYGAVKYNATSPRFTTYTSSQTSVQLYKKTSSTSGGGSTTTTTTYYTTVASSSSGSSSSSTSGTTYKLVTTTPTSWAGDYVIVGKTSSTSYVLDASSSYTGTTLGGTSGAKTLAAAGITLSGDTLSGVDTKYVYTCAQVGSYYSFKMKNSSNYLTYKSSGLTTSTSNSSTSAQWALSVSSGKITMKSRASSTYKLLFNTSSKMFRCYTSSVYSLYFYKAV